MKDVQSKWLVFLWFIIIMYLAELALTKNKSKQSSEIWIKNKHPTVESIAIENSGCKY